MDGVSKVLDASSGGKGINWGVGVGLWTVFVEISCQILQFNQKNTSQYDRLFLNAHLLTIHEQHFCSFDVTYGTVFKNIVN